VTVAPEATRNSGLRIRVRELVAEAARLGYSRADVIDMIRGMP
jgi:hypothetical protein